MDKNIKLSLSESTEDTVPLKSHYANHWLQKLTVRQNTDFHSKTLVFRQNLMQFNDRTNVLYESRTQNIVNRIRDYMSNDDQNYSNDTIAHSGNGRQLLMSYWVAGTHKSITTWPGRRWELLNTTESTQ